MCDDLKNISRKFKRNSRCYENQVANQSQALLKMAFTAVFSHVGSNFADAVVVKIRTLMEFIQFLQLNADFLAVPCLDYGLLKTKLPRVVKF